jgi:VanZ family protein
LFVWAVVFRTRDFFRYWLPPILWMSLIFWGSTDALSSRQTSRIIGPILRWFVPDVREETIAAVQMVVRKGGHMGEYGALCLLFWRALYRPQWKSRKQWSRTAAWYALGFSFLYALSDEWHQSFVASREGSLRDVGFDTSGAALALVLLWQVGRWWGWWQSTASGDVKS